MKWAELKTNKSSDARILVVSDDISEDGGIRSRVLGELSVISHGSELDIIVKIRAANLHRMDVARSVIGRTLPSARLVFVPYLPHRNLPLAKELITIFNVFSLVAAGLMIGLRRRPRTVYSHNMECSMAAVILGKLLGVRVTGDFHGDEVEENLVAFGWKREGMRDRLWKRILGGVVRACTLVVCVSKKHQAHFQVVYRRSSPITVIPCCADADKDTNEAHGNTADSHLSKGCEGKFVLFYSGSSSPHQQIPKMLEFHESLGRSGTGSCLLLLISDKVPQISMQNLSDSSRQLVKITTVPHEQVRGYAERSNAGLLFRDDQVFNNISSPTKFSEYLMAGLPVLLSPRIGDFSELVESLGLGCVVDLQRVGDSDYVAGLIRKIEEDPGIRSRCRDYGISNLSWKAFEPTIRSAFRVRD